MGSSSGGRASGTPDLRRLGLPDRSFRFQLLLVVLLPVAAFGQAIARTSSPLTSFFCFSLVMPFGTERSLIMTQFRAGAGLFACDDYLVISNQSAVELFGEEGASISVSALDRPLAAPRGGARTAIWVEVWKRVFEESNWERYDWVLKLDPDAVIVPQRLRKILWLQCIDGPCKPNYLLTWGLDMHGPIEAMSNEGAKNMAADGSRCAHEIDYMREGIPGIVGMGEDWYFAECQNLLGNSGVEEPQLLMDVCPQCTCEGSRKAVLHPFKTADAYSDCLRNATEAEFQFETSIPSGDNPGALRPTSILCFALIAPDSYHVQLLKSARAAGSGLFRCDEYLFFSNVSAMELFGYDSAGIAVTVLDGPVHVVSSDECQTYLRSEGCGWTYDWACPGAESGAHGFVSDLTTVGALCCCSQGLSVDMVITAWRVLLGNHNFGAHDWLVRLEPDIVVIPDRLQNILWVECSLHRECGAVRLRPFTVGEAGPVDAISKTAAEAFVAGSGELCGDLFNQKGESMSAAWAVRFGQCLEKLEVKNMRSARLLEGWPKGPLNATECNTSFAMFYPLSTWHNYSECTANSTQCLRRSEAQHIGHPISIAQVDDFADANDRIPWGAVLHALCSRWAPLQACGAVAGFVAVWIIVCMRGTEERHAELPAPVGRSVISREPGSRGFSISSSTSNLGADIANSSAAMDDLRRQRMLWIMRLTGLGMQMNAMSLVPIAHRIALRAGASLTASGLVLGAHYGGGALGLVIFYYLSSRTVFGAMLLHTLLMATGSLMCIAGQVWYPSLYLIIFSRVVCGAELGIGLITNVVTVQLSTPSDKARNIMLNDIGCAVGSCFGPLLTPLVPFLPNPLGVTREAQVTVVIMCYGLCLLTAVFAFVPQQAVLEELYVRTSQGAAGGGNSGKKAPEPPPLPPASPGILIGACLALGAMDGMVYRCNMADLVLVVPAEYVLSVEETAGIMGMSHWFRVASMALALRLIAKADTEGMVWHLTVAELAVGMFFFHMSSDLPQRIWAVWPFLVFQAVGVLGAVKGNMLKCLFTGHAGFENKDVIMANSVLSMVGSFLAPVVGRSIAEIYVAQDIMPWYGIISRVMQLGVWSVALSTMGTAISSAPDQERARLL